MRLLNTDRNDANILVRKKKKSLGGNRNSTNSSNSSNSSINNSSNSRNRSNSRNSSNSHNSSNSSIIEYELIPIDHGYCLPHLMEIAWCDWCWFNWPQLKEPLNEQDQKYILSLNPQEEADFLSTRIPLRKACKRNMIIAGTLVQKGVKAGISLYEIAKIMCREDLDKPSTLEKMCLNVFYQIILQQQQYLPHTNGHGLLLPSSPKKMPKIFIDTSSFNFVANPKSPVGPASPPGFWASHHPFRGPHLSLHHHEEVEVEDEEEEEEEVENKDPKRKQNHLFHTNTKSSSSISIVEVGNTSIPWDTMATNALTDALGKSKSKEISKQVFEQEEEEDSPQKIQQKISALATIKSSSTIATNTNTNAGTTTGTTAAASTISCLPHQSCDSNSKSTSTSTSSKSSLEGIGCEKDEFELLNENLDENQQNEKAFFLLLFKYMDDQIQEILLTTQKNK
jgi:hypothetical protein